MFETITWRIMIDAKTKEKAHKIAAKLSNELGEIRVLSLERYWKDKSNFELTCSTPLHVERPEDAVFQMLQIAGHLGNELSVIGPRIYEGNQVEFEGVCAAPKTIGISWFYFEIDNFS